MPVLELLGVIELSNVSTSTESKRKYTRLAESTWAEIEGLWETGETTLGELEARYSVSRRALQARFAKRGIIKGANTFDGAEATEAPDVTSKICGPP